MLKVIFAIGTEDEIQIRTYENDVLSRVHKQQPINELFSYELRVDGEFTCHYIQGYTRGIPVSRNKLMDNKGRLVIVRFIYGPDSSFQRRQFVDGCLIHVSGNNIAKPICAFEYRVEDDLSMKLIAGHARINSIMVDVADYLSVELKKNGTP